MSTKPTKISEFTEILNHVKDNFKTGIPCTIHNLLWQTIVNRVQSRNRVTLYSTVIDGKETLVKVMSSKPGYIDTGVQFNDNVTDKQAKETVNYLNKMLYGQTPDESESIVAKSMKSAIFHDNIE